jgi:hypothetical protein
LLLHFICCKTFCSNDPWNSGKKREIINLTKRPTITGLCSYNSWLTSTEIKKQRRTAAASSMNCQKNLAWNLDSFVFNGFLLFIYILHTTMEPIRIAFKLKNLKRKKRLFTSCPSNTIIVQVLRKKCVSLSNKY